MSKKTEDNFKNYKHCTVLLKTWLFSFSSMNSNQRDSFLSSTSIEITQFQLGFNFVAEDG